MLCCLRSVLRDPQELVQLDPQLLGGSCLHLRLHPDVPPGQPLLFTPPFPPPPPPPLPSPPCPPLALLLSALS